MSNVVRQRLGQREPEDTDLILKPVQMCPKPVVTRSVLSREIFQSLVDPEVTATNPMAGAKSSQRKTLHLLIVTKGRKWLGQQTMVQREQLQAAVQMAVTACSAWLDVPNLKSNPCE